jgi:hypothetical protein
MTAEWSGKNSHPTTTTIAQYRSRHMCGSMANEKLSAERERESCSPQTMEHGTSHHDSYLPSGRPLQFPNRIGLPPIDFKLGPLLFEHRVEPEEITSDNSAALGEFSARSVSSDCPSTSMSMRSEWSLPSAVMQKDSKVGTNVVKKENRKRIYSDLSDDEQLFVEAASKLSLLPDNVASATTLNQQRTKMKGRRKRTAARSAQMALPDRKMDPVNVVSPPFRPLHPPPALVQPSFLHIPENGNSMQLARLAGAH